MFGRSRIAIAVATAVGVTLMPAHSQSSKTPRPINESPLDHPIELAVHDDSAKTEIVKISPPAGEGRIVTSEEPFYQPYACGYVTQSRNANRQRFIYYFSSHRTLLFVSLEDNALVDAMASYDFLPRSPPPDRRASPEDGGHQ